MEARTKRIVAAVVLTAAIITGFVVSGCRSQPDGVPAGGTTSATLARGGELVASYRTEPAGYNRYRDQSAAGELLSRLINAPLVHVDRVALRSGT